MEKNIKRYFTIGVTFTLLLAIFYIIFFREFFDLTMLLEVLFAGIVFGGWYYYDESRKPD